jgi:hypothetical protein
MCGIRRRDDGPPLSTVTEHKISNLLDSGGLRNAEPGYNRSFALDVAVQRPASATPYA